jgi:UPF0755 protein
VKRLTLAVIILLVAAAGLAWAVWQRVDTPFRGFAGEEVFVELPAGTGVAGIARRLADAGVVRDPFTFRLAARLEGADRKLQAGEYRFADAATSRQIVARLARGDVFTRPVTFREGLTIREMADVFESSGLGPRQAFLTAASDGSRMRDWDPDARDLEGYLFPDTYAVPRQASAERLVAAMVDRFRTTFDEGLRARAAVLKMSLRDVVALASLVEKETARADERALVSAVYHNRLRRGMPMQCDPTVIYALMLAGRWNGNIRRADLQIDSPYNTYRYPGLPPGPIAAPGRASLEAALAPADVPYLYFVSRNDGSHVFAETLAEHNRNVARWQLRRSSR